MTTPRVGSLIEIIPGTHGYSDAWVRGTDPIRFAKGVVGILLNVSLPSFNENRTFYKIITNMGVVNIYDKYTRVK